MVNITQEELKKCMYPWMKILGTSLVEYSNGKDVEQNIEAIEVICYLWAGSLMVGPRLRNSIIRRAELCGDIEIFDYPCDHMFRWLVKSNMQKIGNTPIIQLIHNGRGYDVDMTNLSLKYPYGFFRIMRSISDNTAWAWIKFIIKLIFTGKGFKHLGYKSVYFREFNYNDDANVLDVDKLVYRKLFPSPVPNAKLIQRLLTKHTATDIAYRICNRFIKNLDNAFDVYDFNYVADEIIDIIRKDALSDGELLV